MHPLFFFSKHLNFTDFSIPPKIKIKIKQSCSFRSFTPFLSLLNLLAFAFRLPFDDGTQMFIAPAVDESAGVVAAAGARPSPNPKESGE